MSSLKEGKKNVLDPTGSGKSASPFIQGYGFTSVEYYPN